jgi:FolB domain-containing protein
MNDPHNCSITLKKLRFSLNLGVSKEEKATKQDVFITIQLFFSKPPAACFTDNIADTLCYANLVQNLSHAFSVRRYELIEKLANDLAEYILQQSEYGFVTAVNIEVEKHPKLAIDHHGVSFSLYTHRGLEEVVGFRQGIL